jgi:riboflavin kinase/FMN adenylyltransferase
MLFKSLSSLPVDCRDAVIAIGNFDGVHQGHQALIAQAQKKAQSVNKKLGILTFEPHPRALFRPDDPPFRITPLPLKAEKLIGAGADFVVALAFDWPFASQSAEDFIAHILQDGLAAAHIMVGHDFRFGQLRKGTPDMIESAGLSLSVFDDVRDRNGARYASSAVREALRLGDIETANAILGWDWHIEGVIRRGDRRGHELGYPTANVGLADTLHPAYGVYAAKVQIEGEAQWRMAAVNIGIRPMFELQVGQVEAHILDFPDRDIYGQTLKIRPIARLRGEAKFDSLPALIAQIEADVAQTRRILDI